MKLFTCWFPVFIFTIILANRANAQGVTVPILECYDHCAHPRDIDPCCSPNWSAATCFRFDSPPIVINPGTLTIFPAMGFEFICENCCKFKPNECPGNDINPDPRNCAMSPAISWSESISLSVSASISTKVEAVTIALQSAIGVVKGMEASATLTCPLSSPKCKSVACDPSIAYMAGRSVRIDHTWQAVGAWINYGGVGCTGLCPIAGSPWIVGTGACWQNSSYATGDDLIYAKCGSPREKPCPPRFPCN